MFKKGQVVRSLAGRDKSFLLAVTSYDGTYVYVSDGRERPLSNPKRKNPRHVELAGQSVTEESMATDRSLRKVLRCIQM